MTDNLDQPSETRRRELTENLNNTAAFGTLAAERALAWLNPWWTEMGLPRDEKTGFPECPCDVLLHAGALGMLMAWESQGYADRLRPHLPSAEDAFDQFMDRFKCNDFSNGIGDDGAKLLSQVECVHRRLFVPLTNGVLESGSVVTMSGTNPDSKGLDCLAELLMDFQDILNGQDEGE